MKICVICNSEYNETFSYQKYCGTKCKNVRAKQISNKNRVYKLDISWKTTEKTCAPCGTMFIPKVWNQKYCTSECGHKFQTFDYIQKNISSYPDTKAYKWLKARVLVFDRDKYTCQYCGRTPKTHGVVLHVDHKIPKNKGGSFELDNLTTACADCNLGKSDMLLECWKKEKTRS